MTTTKMMTIKKTRSTIEKEFKSSVMGFLTEEGSYSDDFGLVMTSYYKDGSMYRTWSQGTMSTGIVHHIEKTIGTCDVFLDGHVFENTHVLCCQSNNIGKKSFEITSYDDLPHKQTTCRLCYNLDNRIKPSSSFNRKRHGNTKTHQNNKKKCMDAVMDITKTNYDVANFIMSFL